MAVSDDHLQSGSVLVGYRIDEPIGRGGMGVVYRATNVALNRIYALKVLAPGMADDERFRDRFKREMRIAASLHHPNIVGIHYAGERDGVLFFVMDYVTGADLNQILRKHGALEPARAVDLIQQLGSALDAAHGRGLVHRDVKPANIMITVSDGEERAYLTDFGLAKKFDTDSGLTATGAMVGTVDYMAPEQITGARTDARTDVYALGCVFYHMLTGKVPYERENSVATLFAQVHEPPPQLADEITNTYPAFVPVLEKAMAKESSDRYLSAGDFARATAAALKGMRYTAPPSIVGTGEATPLVQPDEATVLADPHETTPPPEPDQATAQADPRETTPSPDRDESVAQSDPRISEPPAPVEVAVPHAASPSVFGEQTRSASPGPSSTAGPTGDQEAPPAPAPPAGDDGRDGGAPGRSLKRYRLPGLAALALIIGAVVAVIVLSSSGSSTPPGQPFVSADQPVPTNRVTGSGNATVRVNGDVASVSVDTKGLLNGSPHAMHIHAGAKGLCPTASAARRHNGHLSISTLDGIKFYGPPQVSLTSNGDTSPKSIVDFSRYPTTGNIRYTRQFTIPPGVAAAIRADNAVIVVHGVDYNHNGIYDDVLDRSDLNPNLPGEATAPALCGRLVPTKSAAATGPGRAAATTYTVALHRYIAQVATPGTGVAATPGTSFALLCHLAAAEATALTDRRAGVGSPT